ncbi:M4 family metallopeptidase [Actinokineospora xionganensis]|uniref:M4 family metallopeptidase n=1 Tax=Actinokineospora xionganensis TaxID=2684470 RepID=A0ABR7L957_9PSEU|nr:M36 family metallopeptidase [Actinokineospora xionganensis]MBC6449097.1 M4 family metallopeptidase [Actinokineospora xionganensis]
MRRRTVLALTLGLAVTAVPAAEAAPTTGVGQVFMVNPVQSSGNQALTDAKDADSAVPASAYATVPLRNLDGSGTLTGRWVNVRAETGNPAKSSDGRFVYTRNQDEFEQVMAYFWGNEAQEYLQSLGFGSQLRPVNAESQDIRTNQWGQDNSYSWDKHDIIRMGKGGVDDAEDGEVIVHEYGHAVHDAQVSGFGTSHEAGSIGEAFGDYLAVTVGLAAAQSYNWPVNAPAACVADWDAVSYTSTEPHCLRRIDTDRKYADMTNTSVHRDGMIWSRALWDIRNALGAKVADRIIINAQFGFAPDTSFTAAALTTIDTANSMYGANAAATVRAAFAARGIPSV